MIKWNFRDNATGLNLMKYLEEPSFQYRWNGKWHKLLQMIAPILPTAKEVRLISCPRDLPPDPSLAYNSMEMLARGKDTLSSIFNDNNWSPTSLF